MKNLILSYTALLLLVSSLVLGKDWPNSPAGTVKPRFGDKLQDSLTTSVNWTNLNPVLRGDPRRLIDTADEAPLRILIDAGHGGRDVGAQSHDGLSEKWVSLQVANLLQRELERQKKLFGVPFQVKLTREEDSSMGLKERVRLANEWGAELFISIHANSSPVPKARGFEVYFLSAEASDRTARELARLENSDIAPEIVSSPVRSMLTDLRANQHVSESAVFAEDIFHSLSLKIRPNIHGIRQGPFAVLAGTLMPAVLVEVGYLTNPEEGKLLGKTSYLKRISTSIAHGVVSYVQSKRKPSYRQARK